jgi:hypothetical protein
MAAIHVHSLKDLDVKSDYIIAKVGRIDKIQNERIKYMTKKHPKRKRAYLAPADENLVTDLVPSEMACLANSPGRMRRTAVWISRDEMVDFFEYDASSVK